MTQILLKQINVQEKFRFQNCCITFICSTNNYMRTTLLLLLFILMNSKPNYAQQMDSTYIKQVDSLVNVSNDFSNNGEFNNALQTIEEANKIASEKMGTKSLSFAKTCDAKAMLLVSYGQDINEAERLYFESIKIKTNLLGKESIGYANSIYNLGSLYGQSNDLVNAEKYIVEALSIYEKIGGKESKSYRQNIGNLGIVYFMTKNYEGAEKIYLEALQLSEKFDGQKTIKYCGTLVNLGVLYSEMSNYEKAKDYFLHALEIIENEIKLSNHPFYSKCLHGLSLLYTRIGDYKNAEFYYNRTLMFIDQKNGKENIEYARTLNDQGILYEYMGEYEKSLENYQQSLVITEKILGKSDPEYVSNLVNIADINRLKGNIESAGKILKNLVKAQRENTSSNPELLALCIYHLANYFNVIGDFSNAIESYMEAKSIKENLGSINNKDFATLLGNIGVLMLNNNQLDESEVYMLKAWELAKVLYSKNSHQYTSLISNLSLCYMDKKDFTSALPLYKELVEIDQNMLKNAAQHLSETELYKFQNTFENRQDYLLEFALVLSNSGIGGSKILPQIAELCFNNSLFYKGYLLNNVCKTKRLVSADTIILAKYKRLNSYQRRLAAEYSKESSSRDLVLIGKLQSIANELEKEIALSIPEINNSNKQVDWMEIKRKLKKDESAIEFVKYYTGKRTSKENIVYAALIVKSNSISPIFVPLCNESYIDSFFRTHSNQDKVHPIYYFSDNEIKSLNQTSSPIYNAIWKPIESFLNGTKTIYFSTSGLLNKINLNAIPITTKQTLADKYQLIECISTRQILDDVPKVYANNAIIYGGIQFDKNPSNTLQVKDLSLRSRGFSSSNSVDSTARKGSWAYLLGTEKEAKAIGNFMKNTSINYSLVTGIDATEESFKKIGTSGNPSPKILHIATHGFFFPDTKKTILTENQLENDNLAFKTSELPMMRSGLLLSGANYAWTGNKLEEGAEDGILTAYEISNMNLSNTELVVLSACETGLGEINGNEGVYGLQRAFKIAGVKYIIMSLWQVPDKQTSMLMTTFYKKWLEPDENNPKKVKPSIPEAFHAAQKELRDIGLDPYQWAGFVLIE